MGPTRTEKSFKTKTKARSSSHPGPSRPHSAVSGAEAGPSNFKRKAKLSNTDSEAAAGALPGVQKIKAAIRQTRRFLAKDNLAPSLRITSERKLKSLERDLAQAEIKRKEKTFSTRYHKVRFFERQKATRKIAQIKKKLSESSSSSSRKTLEQELFEHRVELNYINHYPKTKKYISLFPPEARNPSHQQHDAEAETKAETLNNEEREQLKQWIREQMKNGLLPVEPEEDRESERSQLGLATSMVGAKKLHLQTKGKKVTSVEKPQETEEEEKKDDFFELDVDEGSNEEEEEDEDDDGEEG